VPESLDVKIECAAHHEPGHIVVAAAHGLRVKPEGLILDSLGEGLACYSRQLDSSDASRICVLLATFAGYYAERQFRERRGYPVVDEKYWFFYSYDGHEARQLLGGLSTESLLNGNVPATQAKLQTQSKDMVAQHWDAIEALAMALLAKPFEEWRPLKSGTKLSSATTARYLPGEEVVSILRRHGIPAFCTSEC